MRTNECELLRENVLHPAVLPEITQEQSLELDCVLPDYYPDFFRLLHCAADARILSQEVTDGVLHYTLSVKLRVLYCAEQSSRVQAVTQNLEYQREMPLPPDAAAMQSPQIRIEAASDYLNCRAVNPRRIDIRGAIALHIRISGEKVLSVLTAASGAGLQARTETVSFVQQTVRAEKRFVLSEDIRIPETQSPLLTVLREDAALRITETKAVCGKVVAKGEAAVTLLYAAENGAESLTAVFPFSQICEPEQFYDEMPHCVTAELRDCLITTESENNGDIRLLHCDLQINLRCTAVRTAELPLLTDLYSTQHPVSVQQETLLLAAAPEQIAASQVVHAQLVQPDTVLTKVYAAWASPEKVTVLPAAEGGCTVQGNLRCCVLAADAENQPVMLTGAEPFTWAMPENDAAALPPVTVRSCTYTLTGSDSVSLRAELSVSGNILRTVCKSLLTDAQVDADAPLPDAETFALRLYFAQAGESLWDIAKRCRVPAETLRADNADASDPLTAPQMLLIANA
ncbi:MAG TPA: hypothetical protein DDX71_07860 [Ruminococcus sp.]|nr:hypothetical protein [Ruminococcus sp.]